MEQDLSRTLVHAAGTFLAVPSAFAGVGGGLRHALKLLADTEVSAESWHPLKIQRAFYTDVLLLDLGAVSVPALDPRRIVRGCELAWHIVSVHSERLPEIVRGLRQGTAAGVKAAAALAEQVGIADEMASDGGAEALVALLVVLAAALFAGACATASFTEKPRAFGAGHLAEADPSITY